LELLKEGFPEAKLPKHFNEAQNIVRDLRVDYKKIDTCTNDCMLYWKEHEGAQFCYKCKASRWEYEKITAKVLRYFRLKPTLERLFMCTQTVESMVWHDKERPKDGKKLGTLLVARLKRTLIPCTLIFQEILAM